MSKPSTKTLVLSRSDVQQIVQQCGLDALMDTLTSRLITAIEGFDSAKTDIPIRSGFNYQLPDPGLVEWMPLYDKGEQVVIKLVGYHPNNPQKHGLPTIVSTISAYDTATGHLLGLMDGVLLTALRTGAASAVASKYMAHPDSSTLGLIGCGAQAITQLHAISRIFNIERVLINDTNQANERSFADRCAVLGLNVKVESADVKTLVATADIVCTATSIDPGAGPLFSNVESKPHLHINAVGSDFPEKIELPLDLLHNSFVCPDFRAQAKIEGECQQLEDQHIGPDLATVVQQSPAHKHAQQQRSVFDSTGWVLEDQVVMELFMEYARSFGLGTEMEIETMTGDALNPYDFVKKVSMQLAPNVNS